jgi:hypothetical protein
MSADARSRRRVVRALARDSRRGAPALAWSMLSSRRGIRWERLVARVQRARCSERKAGKSDGKREEWRYGREKEGDGIRRRSKRFLFPCCG